MKKPLDIFTFLRGKKPDWYPAKVKMNKDGSISMISFRDHAFEGYRHYRESRSRSYSEWQQVTCAQ